MRLEKYLGKQLQDGKISVEAVLSWQPWPMDALIDNQSLAQWIPRDDVRVWNEFVQRTGPASGDGLRELGRAVWAGGGWKIPGLMESMEQKAQASRTVRRSWMIEALAPLAESDPIEHRETLERLSPKEQLWCGKAVVLRMWERAEMAMEGVGTIKNLRVEWLSEPHEGIARALEAAELIEPGEPAECAWGRLQAQILKEKLNGGRPLYWSAESIVESLAHASADGRSPRGSDWAALGFDRECQKDERLMKLVERLGTTFEQAMEPWRLGASALPAAAPRKGPRKA